MTDEARDALAFVPKAKELADLVRDRLPPGTHFGVMILVPGKQVGKVVAITSDRKVVAPAVAQWVLTALEPAASGRSGEPNPADIRAADSPEGSTREGDRDNSTVATLDQADPTPASAAAHVRAAAQKIVDWFKAPRGLSELKEATSELERALAE